jgi:phosphate transport system permease protein
MSTLTVAQPAKRFIQASNRNFSNRKIANAMMLILTGLMTLLALIPLFWIIGYVAFRGSQTLSWSFFTQLPKPMGIPGGGVLHAIEGTVIISFLSALFSIPPGLLAAFYLAYHRDSLLGLAVRFSTDVLSGMPSIVIGIFTYALVVKTMGHYSALAGGIALAIIMLPTIIRTTEEMIKLVPHTLREGALALGAPEWKTALQVTLPAALNGIITGVLLGLARATGETAPLLFTALGNDRFEVGQIIQTGMLKHMNIFSILFSVINQPVDSLPLTLYKYTQQPFPELVNQSWAVALVLMIFVLVINIVARLWVMSRTARK